MAAACVAVSWSAAGMFAIAGGAVALVAALGALQRSVREIA
jgi:hypothetical protein